MDDSTPKTDEQFEQWQSDRVLRRTAALRTELIIAEQKLQALRAFMAEAKSKEDVLENWLIEQQLNADYPGAQRALHVQPDGTVRFLDLQD